MTFWQLKYKYFGDEDILHEAEMFFEDPEQAMAFILDSRNEHGINIFDISLVERHTAIWRNRIVLNGKEDE